MQCADANPWDPSILCALEHGHDGIHEARHEPDLIRWAEYCHFPGDGCGPFAHPERLGDVS